MDLIPTTPPSPPSNPAPHNQAGSMPVAAATAPGLPLQNDTLKFDVPLPPKPPTPPSTQKAGPVPPPPPEKKRVTVLTLIKILLLLLLLGIGGCAVYKYAYQKNQSDTPPQITENTAPDSAPVIDTTSSGSETEPVVEKKQNDTDEDGILDYIEVRLGTDPNKVDTDGDGLSDKEELTQHTDPLVATVIPLATEVNPDFYSISVPKSWNRSEEQTDCARIQKLDTLTFIAFTGCSADDTTELLTVNESYQKFIAQFTGASEPEYRFFESSAVQLFTYTGLGEPFVFTPANPSGTIAVWQAQDTNFALIDEDNTHQSDGTFTKVLESFQLNTDSPLTQETDQNDQPLAE